MASVKIVFCGVILLTAGWLASAAAAGAAEKPKQDGQEAVRLKLFRQLAEKAQISVKTGRKPAPVKLLPEPLYRFQRQSKHYADGIVWAWGDGGRPAALLTMFCEIKPGSYLLMYEFQSLSPQPLSCRMEGVAPWAPREAGVAMKPLPAAPPPAADPPGRLRQINELTARMKADEVGDEAEEGKPSQPQKVDLAWLPQPVCRYADPAHGVIDGAVCFACVEGDPEVVLVIEAQRGGSSPPGWYYGFNRASLAEIHVRFDGKPLWTAPKLSDTSPDDAYHLWPMTLTER